MKKLSEALRSTEEFKHYCKRCGENKSVKYFNHSRGVCTLCVSKEDATINMELTRRRRKHEEVREMLRYDTSLESLI